MKIIPEFLKIIDRKLLLNKPLIWRTRIHYLLFFSMMVNVVTVVVCALAPISQQFLPAKDWQAVLLVIGIPLLGFISLFWGYTQYKYKLKGGSFVDKLLTISLYGLGFTALIFNLYFMHLAFSFKIANTVDTATFETESVVFEQYREGNYDADIFKIIKTYGFEKQYKDDINYKGQNHNYYPIKKSMDCIREAKEFAGFKDLHSHEIYLLCLVGLLLMGPMILLLTSFTGIKNLLIIAFSQLMLWMGAGFLTWSGSGIFVNYGIFTFILVIVLFAKSNKSSYIIELGHYLLISMISFIGISLFFAILEEHTKEFTTYTILILILLLSYFFFLAVAASMTSNLKAKPM